MNEDIKKDGNLDNNEKEIDIKDLNNVNGGAYQGPSDPNHRRS